MIDGHGMAMFVNHSCDPNCETDEEDGRVFIASIRDIAAGDELTYDYCLYDGDDDAPCYCGSKDCRGSMYSPEELKKKARAEARKKKQAELAAKEEAPGAASQGCSGRNVTGTNAAFETTPSTPSAKLSAGAHRPGGDRVSRHCGSQIRPFCCSPVPRQHTV